MRLQRDTAATRVLSMYSDDAYVTQALSAVAAGYPLKDSADLDLLSINA